MNGSGEPEWEEKNVPKVSKRSGQESEVLRCRRWAALGSRPCGHLTGRLTWYGSMHR